MRLEAILCGCIAMQKTLILIYVYMALFCYFVIFISDQQIGMHAYAFLSEKLKLHILIA